MPVPPSRPNPRIAENRDHAAALIEEQMRELARSEGTKLVLETKDDGRVKARLAAVSARGENVDIAIMRLANALLDEPRYNARLTRALNGVSGLFLDQNSGSEREGIALSSSP